MINYKFINGIASKESINKFSEASIKMVRLCDEAVAAIRWL